MTPYEFGYQVGHTEKTAAGGRTFGAIQNFLSGLASGGNLINSGAKRVVKGFGQGLEGAGKAIGSRARPTFDPKGGTSLGNSEGLAALLLQLGRGMQSTGKGMIDAVPSGSTRATRDIRGVLGHGMRLGGSAVRGGGHATALAGEGLQAVGRGVSALGGAHYGVPTLAAAGLLSGTAAVAPKLPLPGVKFQTPLDFDFKYKTQAPVEFEW